MQLSKESVNQINSAIRYFNKNKYIFESHASNLHNNILMNPKLKKLIHSAKYRIKKPDHLRDKLSRLAIEAKEKKEVFDIVNENLFSKVNDLDSFAHQTNGQNTSASTQSL